MAINSLRKEYMRLYKNLRKRINYAEKSGLGRLQQVSYLKSFKPSSSYNDSALKYKLREIKKVLSSEKYKTRALRKKKTEYVQKAVERGGSEQSWTLEQDLFFYLQSAGLLESYYAVLSSFLASDEFYKSRTVEEAMEQLKKFREKEYKEMEEYSTTIFKDLWR